MFRLLCVVALLSPAAFAQDYEALVKKLFPKNERMAGLNLPEIARRLEVKPGAKIADVGAGAGGVSKFLSHAVGPAGRVYAVDIDEKRSVKPMRRMVKKEKLRNIEVILGKPDDPRLPAAAIDSVLIVNSYHEFEKHEAMLARLVQALKPGGRLVVVDPLAMKTRDRPRASQMKNHVLAPELAEADLRAAGFEILDRQDRFIDLPDEEGAQWLIVATRR